MSMRHQLAQHFCVCLKTRKKASCGKLRVSCGNVRVSCGNVCHSYKHSRVGKISSVDRFFGCARRSRRALEPKLSGRRSRVYRPFEFLDLTRIQATGKGHVEQGEERHACAASPLKSCDVRLAWSRTSRNLFFRYVLVGQTTLGNDFEANVQQYNSASS